MPKGAVFWTPYRRLYAAEKLAHGESVALVAQRLGTKPAYLRQAIKRYDLRNPEVLQDRKRDQ